MIQSIINTLTKYSCKSVIQSINNTITKYSCKSVIQSIINTITKYSCKSVIQSIINTITKYSCKSVTQSIINTITKYSCKSVIQSIINTIALYKNDTINLLKQNAQWIGLVKRSNRNFDILLLLFSHCLHQFIRNNLFRIFNNKKINHSLTYKMCSNYHKHVAWAFSLQ